jgi:hypothetical protein
MSFRWAPGGGDECARHGADAMCNCFAVTTAAQSLDELAFTRSACQAAAAGAAARLEAILDRAPDAVHSDGGKGGLGERLLQPAQRRRGPGGGGWVVKGAVGRHLPGQPPARRCPSNPSVAAASGSAGAPLAARRPLA